ncbi:hypothetical protein [Nocardia goodfellowii]|uniref:DUF222 domain-containing protein n=1 Tax=Nocardia goodfellowii TaxID=882446 RepID=A0ABS4QM87_9NOCA|nr:hypothetical protein [Nocardia goodfellowii]MBP2192817.1 hypothetical protein [Nocardia goodfellowii]
MLATQLAHLLDEPAGIAEVLEVIAGFDDALVHGFARIGDEQAAALAALAGAVAGSPLAGPVAAAVAELSTGSIGPEKLAALAAARAALLGAVHDALAGQFDTTLGRPRSEWAQADSSTVAPGNLVAGCRSWLQELAISGWRGVDHDLVAAVDQTVEALWGDPALRRLAVLLDGFAAELSASCPVATMDRVPVKRWADLWARALLLSWRGDETRAAATISGRLLILGVDVHEHGTAVQAQVYGVLEGSDGVNRRVRVSVSAAKVDTIVGPAVWQVLGAHPQLLKALADHRSLDVTDLPLTANGDLLWHDDRAGLGSPADPFATARIQLATATGPAVPPLDRDPVHLAEPVLLEGYRVKEGALELDGHRLVLELDRLPGCGPLTPSSLTGSAACLGLLRWDAGQWTLRPLAVQKKVKNVVTEIHGGDWACGPTDPKVVKALAKSGDSVAVLRERAGRLLRK